MAGTFTISGMSAGEPAGQRVFGPITVTGSTVIGATLEVALNSGDNTITVPTSSVAVMVIPPANNATVIKYRTSLNSGDAGLPVYAGALPFVHVFPATPPTTVILNAASTISTFTTVVFI